MIENRLKKGLGRGLSSLLGDTPEKTKTDKVLITDISRNKFQPIRKSSGHCDYSSGVLRTPSKASS